MEQRDLILIQGISGSGKTTEAKKWVEEDPIHRIRLNYDDIRTMLGKYWVPEREPLMKSIFNNGLQEAMTQGYNIIIDNMSNLNPKHIKEYQELVKEFNSKHSINYSIEFKLLNTPVEECIRRDSLRTIPIGEKIIKEQWRKYRDFIIQESINSMPVASQDPKLPHCIIVDMDATLCLNRSKRPFFGPGAAEKMMSDEPIEPVCNLVRSYCYDRDCELIIITGRDEPCREVTLKWLDKHWLYPNRLLMRQEGDYTPGPELKKSIYENNILNKYYVDFVVEDSTKVVNMWRSLGLICLQPNDGKF
jgi:predicted kinase